MLERTHGSIARRALRNAALLLGSLTALCCSRVALAAERHFGFSYESAVQAAGTAELEPWTTLAAGRVEYYSSLGAQLGVDFGIAKNFEGALFYDLSSVAADVLIPGATAPTRLTTTDFQSVSARLKYRLSSPIADALGSALMLEGSYGPSLTGFQGRLVLDDQLGSLLLAANVSAGVVEQLDRRSTSEGRAGASLAAGYFVTSAFVTSIEARSETLFDSNIDSSVLFVGPSLSWLADRYWATLAVEPQIAAFKGSTPGRSLDLSQNERLQARLLLGFRL